MEMNLQSPKILPFLIVNVKIVFFVVVSWLLAFLLLFSCMLFLGLFLHNQQSTEYLLVLDTWRFFNKMHLDVPLREYLFHNVHVFALPSAILYMDVLFASGNLSFLHAAVLVGTLLAMVAMAVSISDIRENDVVGFPVNLVLALLLFAVWLSPSNARAYTYPLLDVISTFSLLAIFCISLFYVKVVNSGKKIRAYFYFFLALSSLIGIAALEVFVAPLGMLLLITLLHRRHALAMAGSVVLLGFVFWYFSHQEMVIGGVQAGEVDLYALTRNMLLFLSSQLYFLVHHGFEFDRDLSVLVAVGFSAYISLFSIYAFLITTANEDYRSTSAISSLLVIVFALASLSSAVWLRFSSGVVDYAVPRYTVYAVLFSMGVLIVAFKILRSQTRVTGKAWAGTVVASYVAMLAGDSWVYYSKNYNMGDFFVGVRAEMAVYAQSPGFEINLGPIETDQGRYYRAELYDYLKEERISVFGTTLFGMLGNRVDVSHAQVKQCILANERAEVRVGQKYVKAEFIADEVSPNGAFITVSDGGKLAWVALPVVRGVSADRFEVILPYDFFKKGRMYYLQNRDDLNGWMGECEA